MRVKPLPFKLVIIIILSITVLSPLIVNLLLCINNPMEKVFPVMGDSNGWISFWGSVSGALISGIIVLIVLRYTIHENLIIQETQIKVIQYTQKKLWLDNLRKQLIDNYKIIDFHSLSMVINQIKQGKYDDANSLLLLINRNIEFQGSSSSFYFLADNLSEEESQYNISFKSIIIEFGCLINDLIFLVMLYTEREADKCSTPEMVINLAENSLQLFELSATIDPDITKYFKDNSIMYKIKNIDANGQFDEELETIIKTTMKSTVNIHMRKYDLIKCTEQVLRYEEIEIEKILIK